MMNFYLNKSLAITVVVISSFLLFGCKKGVELSETEESILNVDDKMKNILVPFPIVEMGWVCESSLQYDGSEIGKTIGFYNFFLDNDRKKFMSISQLKFQGSPEITYVKTGDYSYEYQDLTLKTDDDSVIFTDKSSKIINDTFINKSEIISAIKSGDLSESNSITLRVFSVSDSGSFDAENNDVHMSCRMDKDVGLFFKDNIDENHRLIQKLEQ